MGSPFRIRFVLGQSRTKPTDPIYSLSCPGRERGTASRRMMDENGIKGTRGQERVFAPGTCL